MITQIFAGAKISVGAEGFEELPEGGVLPRPRFARTRQNAGGRFSPQWKQIKIYKYLRYLKFLCAPTRIRTWIRCLRGSYSAIELWGQ